MAGLAKGWDVAPKDYIIEQGTNYEKWNSGKMRQWGQGVTDATALNASTAILTYYTTKSIVFPIAFTSIQGCDCQGGSNYNDVSSTIYGLSTTLFTFVLSGGRSDGVINKPFYWEAIGRWS